MVNSSNNFNGKTVFCLNTRKQNTLSWRDFILMSTERTKVPLYNDSRDFRNSPPLERSGYFIWDNRQKF